MTSTILGVIAVCLTVLTSQECLAAPKAVRAEAKRFERGHFYLRAPVVKLSYSLGEDKHPTNVYADGSIVYRVKTRDLQEGEGRTLGEQLGSGLAKAALEGGNEMVDSDPQEFIAQVRSENRKFRGQVIPVGAKVKVQEVILKDDSATLKVRSASGIQSKVYLRFSDDHYAVDEFTRVFSLMFSTEPPTDPVNSTPRTDSEPATVVGTWQLDFMALSQQIGLPDTVTVDGVGVTSAMVLNADHTFEQFGGTREGQATSSKGTWTLAAADTLVVNTMVASDGSVGLRRLVLEDGALVQSGTGSPADPILRAEWTKITE